MSTTDAGDAPPYHGPGTSPSRDDRRRKKQYKVRIRRSQIEALFRIARFEDTPLTTLIRRCGLSRARHANPRDDPSTIVQVWLDDDERAIIDSAATREHTKPSTFLRDAAVSYAAHQSRPSPSGNGGAGGYKPEGRAGPGPAPRQNGGIGFVR